MVAPTKGLKALLLTMLTLCWGPAFFLIKIALTEIPTFTIVTARLFIGGLFLLILIKIQRCSLLKWAYLWKHFLVMSLLTNIIPFSLVNYAELVISSSLAGILNASQPIFTLVLAHYFIDSEKFSVKTLIGICIGLSGIVLIFLPSLFGVRVGFLGVLYSSIAAIFSAGAIVYAKRFLSHIPNLIAPTYQLLIGAVISCPFAFFIEKCYLLPKPSLEVCLSLLALGILCTATAFIIYYYLVTHAGATYLSTASVLLPFVAIFLGVLILGERLYWTSYIGCFLILAGLIITNSLITSKELKFLKKILFKTNKF